MVNIQQIGLDRREDLTITVSLITTLQLIANEEEALITTGEGIPLNMMIGEALFLMRPMERIALPEVTILLPLIDIIGILLRIEEIIMGHIIAPDMSLERGHGTQETVKFKTIPPVLLQCMAPQIKSSRLLRTKLSLLVQRSILPCVSSEMSWSNMSIAQTLRKVQRGRKDTDKQKNQGKWRKLHYKWSELLFPLKEILRDPLHLSYLLLRRESRQI